MKLILVRHAEAEPVGEGGAATDYDRALTELGQKQADALTQAIAKLKLPLGLVLTSPYVRALQTAEPLAAILTPGTPPQKEDHLRLEEMKPRKLAKVIAELGQTVVYVVGHMPDLGRFAGWLLGCGTTTILFEKSAAALITTGKSVEKGTGELRWLATPDWFMDHPTA
ncbi:MAG: phosphoglycerate mutase family protein [Gemmataceae bacterium]